MSPSDSVPADRPYLLLGAESSAGRAFVSELESRGHTVVSVHPTSEDRHPDPFPSAAEALAEARKKGPFAALVIAATSADSLLRTARSEFFTADVAWPLVFLKGIGKDFATAGRGQVLLLVTSEAFIPKAGAASAASAGAWAASLGAALAEEWRVHEITVTVYCQGSEQFDAAQALSSLEKGESLAFSDKTTARRARKQIRRGSPAAPSRS